VLRAVRDVRRFNCTEDLAELLPEGLPSAFTTADIATRASVRRDVAQRMAFCFRSLDIISEVGRTKAGISYTFGPRR
jgi:hypothetical protein